MGVAGSTVVGLPMTACDERQEGCRRSISGGRSDPPLRRRSPQPEERQDAAGTRERFGRDSLRRSWSGVDGAAGSVPRYQAWEGAHGLESYGLWVGYEVRPQAGAWEAA